MNHRCTALDRSSNGSLKDFTCLKLIGKGTFGKVYRAIRIADNKEYAIKELMMGAMTSKEKQDALNEVRVLASIDSTPNTIRYYDAFLENDRLLIVTEYARGGDLAAKIKRNLDRKERMDEHTIWTFFVQICLGLKALHASRVIHRDIKSANIYLVDSRHLAIGDFGICKVLKCSNAMASTQIGTPYYMAPEIWSNQRYNDKCDIWALGVVLYELAALRHPFVAATENSLRDRILKGHFDPLPSCYSPALRDVIRMLLTVDPKSRPSIEQVLAHPAVSRYAAVEGDLGSSGMAAMLDTIKAPFGLPRRVAPRLPGPMYDALRAVQPPDPAPAARLPPIPHLAAPPSVAASSHISHDMLAPASGRISEPGGPAGPRTRFSSCLPGPESRFSLPELPAFRGPPGQTPVLILGQHPAAPWNRCGGPPSRRRGRRAESDILAAHPQRLT